MNTDEWFLQWWNEEIVGYLDNQGLLSDQEERKTAYAAALLAYRQGMKDQKKTLAGYAKKNAGTHKWKKELARFCKKLCEADHSLEVRIDALRKFAHEARGDSARYGKEDRIRAQAFALALQPGTGEPSANYVAPGGGKPTPVRELLEVLEARVAHIERHLAVPVEAVNGDKTPPDPSPASSEPKLERDGSMDVFGGIGKLEDE